MKILDRLEEWIISLMLFAMTALAFMQVVRRYVFNTGFSWTLELTMLLFACMIFVGISYGVRVGSHIGVDALVRLMPHHTRRYVSMLAVLLSLVYVGLVLYGSTIYVSKMMEIGVELDDLPIELQNMMVLGGKVCATWALAGLSVAHVSTRLDRRRRRRKFLITTLLRAIGYSSDIDLLNLFYEIKDLKVANDLRGRILYFSLNQKNPILAKP